MICQPLSHRIALLTVRRALPLAMAATLGLSLSACGGAQKTATAASVSNLPATAVCPVTKETIKPTATTKTVVHNGKTYYMCCPGCAGKFAANPGKYLANAAAPAKPCDGGCDKKDGAAAKPCDDCEKGTKGAAVAAPAAAKPCTDCEKKDGAAAKPCDDCEKGTKGAAAAAPAAATTGAAALPATAVCPVSGKTFKPTAETAKATHNGKTYYLCCDGCVKKFAADPAKYAK